jgi:hypothetical protein
MDPKSFGGKQWVVIGLIVLALFFLGTNPEIVKRVTQSYKSHDPPTDLERAELKGRLEHALSYGKEVQSRLDAYKARFDCREAQLLDEAFLEPTGPLALSPLRKDWFEARRTLTEYLEKDRLYMQKCRTAISAVSRPDKAEEWMDFPEEFMAWSAELDEAITERTRKLPLFTRVALELQMKQGRKR